MFRKCCVVGCDSRRDVVKLFNFPKTEIGLDNWLKCVSGSNQKSVSELRKLYVCEKHFEKRFVTPKSRLRHGAYPTLLTADEIANGFPDTPDNDTENCNPNIDHDYCIIEHNDHNYCKESNPMAGKETRPSCSLNPEPLEHSLQEEVASAISGKETRPSCSVNPEPLEHSLQEEVASAISGKETRPSCSLNPEPLEHSLQEEVASAISGKETRPSCSVNPEPLEHSLQEEVASAISGQETRPSCSVNPEPLEHSLQEEVASAISGKETRPSCSVNPEPLEDSLQEEVASAISGSSCSLTQATLGASHQEIVLSTLSGKDTSPSCSVTQDTLGSSLQEISASAISGMSTPKVKTFRKRLVNRTALLTPNCKKLYIEYKKTNRKLEFCKKTRKFATAYSTETSFKKMTEGLTHGARTLMWMQIKQSGKKNKGRRFSREEKLYCLSIMKQSPKCYRFLQKIFTLPSKTTLNKFISELKIEAGINPHIFQAIGKEVNTWDENRKYCSILFDEVALEPGLSYDKHKDVIEGFVELDVKTNEFADHALVFMLRGAIQKWEQPVAYYFCKGQTPSVQLVHIIKKIVSAVTDTGLKPVALVSDQGGAFRSALRTLQQESRREQILSGGQIDDIIIIGQSRLRVVYDPPHLLKGLRNNFLTNEIKFEGKTARWSDVVEVYKTDCKHAKSRLLHKLTDECVIPEKVKKMKVKNCARVFSKTMAATLAYSSEFSTYADGTPVSPTLKNTSEVITFFDDLFDSVNGVSFAAKKKGKPLRSVVTKDSEHLQFWPEAIKKISNMKYVDKLGKEKSVPTLNNWLITLKSYQRMWNYFNEKNIKIMRPRYFNSDPIENFFGQVRAYNYRNNNPDCHTFKNTFRSLLITRFIKFHCSTYNCEEDSAEQLLKLEALFTTVYSTENDSAESSNNNLSFNPESFQVTANQERLNVHSQAYTAGWVIRKILKNINCATCESNLTSNQASSIHKWISFREFNSIKNNFKKLTYPSEQAVRFYKYITKETIEYLENHPHRLNILKIIKALIKSKYSMDFLACETHKNVQEDFLNYTLRLAIFNWCNAINRIIKGTDLYRLPTKLPPMQHKALEKYKKKMKNRK